LRFVRPRLARSGPHRVPSKVGRRFAASILQLKRCFPELPIVLKVTTAIKHRERLSTDNWVTQKPFLDSIRRTVNELFPPGWDLDKFRERPQYCMSNKACAEASRQAGGNQGAMIDAMETFESGSDFEDRPANWSLRQEELHSMYNHMGRTIVVYSYIGDLLSRVKRERVLDMFLRRTIPTHVRLTSALLQIRENGGQSPRRIGSMDDSNRTRRRYTGIFVNSISFD
jgi:hypothetical protein